MLNLSRRALFTALLIGLLAVIGATAFAQAPAAGLVRFVHVVPGAAAIDIYTDGQLTISGLDYGQASAFITLTAGERQIAVTPAGLTTQLWSQPVTVEADSAVTLVASATDPLGFQPFRTDLSPLDVGESRLTALHAVNSAPTVDVVLANGSPVAPALAYNQPFGTLDIPSGTYEIGVIPSGGSVEEPILEPQALSFNSGASYLLVVYGTPAAPQTALFSASVNPADADSGFVRFAHGVSAAPAVSVLLDGSVVAPALSFGEATNYIALPAGEYELAIRQPGDETDLLTGTLSLAAGDRVTAAALGTPDAFGVQRFDDDLTGIAADTAVISLINGLEDVEAAAGLASGDSLIDAVASGESAAITLPPTAEDLLVTVGEADIEVALPGGIYGGVFYDLLVTGDADGEPTVLLLPPVSLAQALDSAPGDVTLVAAEPTGAPTDVPAVAVLPTTAAEQRPVAVAATPTPTPAAAVTTPAPTVPTVAATPRPPLPAARVQLDPGANLQLRQYPRADALSLGLAPSGTVLTVLGRPGQDTPPIGTTPDPSATPFVDPASLLPADQDFDPATTWLFVEYQTPDGGVIEAWVNALYLAVSTPDGERQRLADLPTIPANRAGAAVNTAVQPPSERQDVVTVTIINLDPGVNLNIRRTVGAEGEALARVPVGTTTEFRGISENGQWVFVRASVDGGSVDGWISGTYAEFALNGAPVTVEELIERELLVILPDTTRGGTSTGAVLPSVGQPTPSVPRDAVVGEIILDPGANLHLRRRANRDSQSLALIPAGTQVVISGRNELGDWLNVTFEGVNGWVSTQYLFVTQNGRRFDPLTLPVVPEVTPTITPIDFLATATPIGFVAPATPVPATGLNPAFPVGTDDPNLDPVPGG